MSLADFWLPSTGCQLVQLPFDVLENVGWEVDLLLMEFGDLFSHKPHFQVSKKSVFKSKTRKSEYFTNLGFGRGPQFPSNLRAQVVFCEVAIQFDQSWWFYRAIKLGSISSGWICLGKNPPRWWCFLHFPSGTRVPNLKKYGAKSNFGHVCPRISDKSLKPPTVTCKHQTSQKNSSVKAPTLRYSKHSDGKMPQFVNEFPIQKTGNFQSANVRLLELVTREQTTRFCVKNVHP